MVPSWICFRCATMVTPWCPFHSTVPFSFQWIPLSSIFKCHLNYGFIVKSPLENVPLTPQIHRYSVEQTVMSLDSWTAVIVKPEESSLALLFFFFPSLKFCVFSWLFKRSFICQGAMSLNLKCCLGHQMLFFNYSGTIKTSASSAQKLEAHSRFSNKSLILLNKKTEKENIVENFVRP